MCGSSFPSSSCQVRTTDNLVIIGQVTLRDVLSVDVMEALKHSMLKLREAAGDGGEDDEDVAEAEVDEHHSGSGAVGNEIGGAALARAGDNRDSEKGHGGRISVIHHAGAGAGSRGSSTALVGAGSEGSGADTAVGPVICGRRSVQLTVGACSDTGEAPTPDQAEEDVVKENLMLWTLQRVIIWVKGAGTLVDRIVAALEQPLERSPFPSAQVSMDAQRYRVPDSVLARSRERVDWG